MTTPGRRVHGCRAGRIARPRRPATAPSAAACARRRVPCPRRRRSSRLRLHPHQHPDQVGDRGGPGAGALEHEQRLRPRRDGSRPSRRAPSPTASTGSARPGERLEERLDRAGEAPAARATPEQLVAVHDVRLGNDVRDGRGQRGLAGPGGAVDAHQAARSERRGAASTCAANLAGDEWRGRSSEGTVAAAVGRHHLGDGLPTHQVHVTDVLEELTRLGVPEPHQVTDPQLRGRVAGQRGLDLAGALQPRQVQPRRGPRDGKRSAPVAPLAISPPPCTVAISGVGLRVTRSPKNAAGRGSNDA